MPDKDEPTDNPDHVDQREIFMKSNEWLMRFMESNEWLMRLDKENEKLCLENERLKKENEKLRLKNERFMKSNEWLMRLDKENEILRLENERLDKENEILRLENERFMKSNEWLMRSDFSSYSEEEDVAADDVDRDSNSDSDESTASSVSFKSDRSKDKFIDFKGQLSPKSDVSSPSSPSSEEEDVAADDFDSEPVSRKRRASPRSSCASIKSEGSPGYINAKRRRSEERNEFKEEMKRSDFSSYSEEEDVAADDVDRDSDSDESTASSVSFKSDRSKDKVIKFKGQLSPRSDVSPPPLPHQKRRMLQQMMLTINRKMTSRPADE